MDAADPLCAVSSPAQLLPRILGPVPAASLSEHHEALLDAISQPLRGSKELLDQARVVMKERGDIRMLYQDDGAKAGAPAYDKKEQQGRRPGLDRRRARFSKPPPSKALPVMDRSRLLSISDPVEYFQALDDFDEAVLEIKRLNGEAIPEKTLNFEPVLKRKRRPGLPGRKSVRTSKFRERLGTLDPIELSASQKGTMTESQLSQDDAHVAGSKENEQSVPTRSDSFPQKDVGDDLTYLLTSLGNLDESEGEEFLRKTLGIKEIRMEKIRDSIPGVRSLRSDTVQKSPKRVRTPKRSLPGSREAQISELAKLVFCRDPAKDKQADLLEDNESEGSPDIVMGERSPVSDSSDILRTDAAFTEREIERETPNLSTKSVEAKDKHADLLEDDKSEGSPDVVMGEPSLVRESSDVLRTDEAFTERGIERETPNLSTKLAEHVLDPKPNMPDCVNERQGGSPLSKVAKQKAAYSRHNVSMQEDDGPIDYPPVDMSDNETEVAPSHHLEGSSTEVLVSTPGRNVAPNATSTTFQAAEDNVQHLEVVEEDGVLDNSSCPLEIPLEDTDTQNQSQMRGGNIKNLAADLRNALSPTKEKKQQAARKGKKKRQSERGQKVADESSHPPEIPQANFDSENQPHVDGVNNEQQVVGASDALSPKQAKGQKGAQRRNKNRRQSLTDAGLKWQSGVRTSTRIRSRPLEHWLGERFVYGRIHDSMATVIGIKAYSPGQDGKKTLKVKSFVPEQYSDLVSQAAKY